MLSYNQQNANIKLYFNKKCFYVGEFIKGNIEVNLDSIGVLNGILIEIYSNETWKIKDYKEIKTKLVKSMNDRQLIVKYELDLSKFDFEKIDNSFILPQGKNIIPFNFRFSEENTPVFEYPTNDKRGSARYDFCVTMQSPYIKGNVSAFLCLISRPIMDSENLTKSITQQVYKWNLIGRGETLLEVKLPDNNFKYDSLSKVIILIDNTNGKTAVKEYKIMLIRKVKFKNKLGEIKYTDETNLVVEKVKAYVAAGVKQSFQYNLHFKENNPGQKFNYTNELNPYNIQMDQINFYMPTFHGKLISCDYEIKVSVYYDVFVGYNYRPRVIMPVYLVHQLPMDYQLEIQEQIEYENALKKSMIDDNINVNKKNNKINITGNNDMIIANNDINPKIEENNNFGNNYMQNNEEDEDELPSLEAINEAHLKNKEKEIKEKQEKELNQNKINHINEECPPCVFESAPVPFQIKNENNDINNAYPIYEPNNFNNIDKNDNDEKHLDNDRNSDNQNKINEIPEEDDFSLFNTDSNSYNKKEHLENNNNNENIYKDINEI